MYNPEVSIGIELMAERKRRGHVLISDNTSRTITISLQNDHISLCGIEPNMLAGFQHLEGIIT